jgi:hypothetical protein
MIESFIVCVGKKAKEFPVVKSIATRSSKFFEAAMSRDWKEAREKRVSLPDVEVRIFESYVQWLYTSELVTSGSSEAVDFAQLYILGDFLDDLAFRHAVLDSIMSGFLEDKRPPGGKAVQLAWDYTPSNSALRRLVKEIWSTMQFAYSITWLLEITPETQQYPREFVKQHFEHFMSSNELDRQTSTVRTREEVMADFKLQLSEDAASAKKEAEEKK